MAKETHKPKSKSEPDRDKEPDKPAPPVPPRPHTQEIQARAPAPQAQAPAPMPRPIFGRRPGSSGDQVMPVDAQRVINALQQTVRSQAILIRQYQELLKLDGRPVEEEDQTDQSGPADEGEAA